MSDAGVQSWDTYYLSATEFADGSLVSTLLNGVDGDNSTTTGGAIGIYALDSSATLDPGSPGTALTDDDSNGAVQENYIGQATINGQIVIFASATVSDTNIIIAYVPHTPPAGDTYITVGDISGQPSSIISDTAFDIPCFVAGTMIRTPDGDRAVESLRAGDLVMTSDGTTKSVLWLGRSTKATLFADPARVLPIRIKAGALGESLPERDLLVSPGHAMLVEGVLVQAGALVNGTSVVRETNVPATFTYYHVDTGAHDLLIAEGAVTESFLLGVEDMGFDNWAERPAGAAMPEELAYPRAKAARQMPGAVRDLLAVRSAAIAPAFAVAA